MAPSGRGGRRRRKNQRRWCQLPCGKKAKKSAEAMKKAGKPTRTNKPEADAGSDGGGDALPSGCCTPKDQRFRIPECMACPPAPKKRRPAAGHCSSQRRPISFFTPPDLELFFLLAFPHVSF